MTGDTRQPLGHHPNYYSRVDPVSGFAVSRSGKLITTLMVNDVTADPLAVANQLRPALLRLARELRRETEQLGITSRQGTLLWLIRGNPA